MKLSDWARGQGISYITAYRWFKGGKLPVRAYQTESGTIIVEKKEENMLSRLNNRSGDALLNMLQDASSVLDVFDSFAPTYWSNVKRPNSKFKTLNNENEYVVIGEVPGFEENEIKISVKDNVLHISGKHEIDDKSSNYFSKENSSFDVMYTLPHNVDIENIAADHRCGILEVKIPKENNKKIKEIPIKRLRE